MLHVLASWKTEQAKKVVAKLFNAMITYGELVAKLSALVQNKGKHVYNFLSSSNEASKSVSSLILSIS